MNDLLNKYWEGQTSLEEEQQLSSYFNSKDVAPEHEVYRSIFNSFELEQCLEEGSFDAFAKVKQERQAASQFKKRTWKGLGIAAGFAILVAVGSGLYEQPESNNLGTVANAEEAREETMKMLEMVSNRLNQGKRNMSPIKTLDNKTAAVFNLK